MDFHGFSSFQTSSQISSFKLPYPIKLQDNKLSRAQGQAESSAPGALTSSWRFWQISEEIWGWFSDIYGYLSIFIDVYVYWWIFMDGDSDSCGISPTIKWNLSPTTNIQKWDLSIHINHWIFDIFRRSAMDWRSNFQDRWNSVLTTRRYD